MSTLNFDKFVGYGMTVYNLDNPHHDAVGTIYYDAVVIGSGYENGTVDYQIMRRDGQGDTIEISSTAAIPITAVPGEHGTILQVDSESLIIVLPMRTEFKVRVRQNSGSWSEWLSFKTRDKRYQSPDAITQLIDDSKTSDPTEKGSKTITVTNVAKASVEYTDAGATVTNTDTGYNDTSSITYTDAGATIVTATGITYTSEGATIIPG